MFVFIGPTARAAADRARSSSTDRLARLVLALRRLDRKRLVRLFGQAAGLVWVVAAILAYPLSEASRQRDARQTIERLGGRYNVSRSAMGDWLPAWLIDCCGGENLYPVRSIDLSFCDVCDDDVAMLLEFRDLEQINLCGCPRITQAGVAQLKRLPRIKLVWVNGMSVDEAGSYLASDSVAASGR